MTTSTAVPRRMFVVLVFVCCTVAFARCTFGPGPVPPSASIASPPEERMFLAPGDPMRGVLARMGWQQDESPLFTDDQRLLTETGDYGPHSEIFPSPELAVMTLANMSPGASEGILVAMVRVNMDPGVTSLPGTYTDLSLSPGLNCIYIRGGHTFTAFIKPANASPPDCDPTGSTTNPLRVQRVESSEYPGFANVPAVARFHEGVNSVRNIEVGAPYLGTKCDDGWCMVLGANVTPLPPPQMEDRTDSRVYEVHGWGDAQVLAIKPPDGADLVRSEQEAFVVPVENLKDINKPQFRQGWQHVATVKFVSGPRGKYMRRWHFEPKTENQIFLRIDTTTGNWQSLVKRRTYWGTWIPMFWKRRFHSKIERDAHDTMDVPPTARFRWDRKDEDLWVRCDAGCCKISDLQ